MSFKDDIIYLEESNIDKFLENINSLPIYRPFSKDIIEKFLLFSDKLLKEDFSSEFKYLGFFFRKSNLETWKRKYYKKCLHPYGIAFHIVPTNVPNIFLFSSMFSVLTGNIAIVRVSSKIISQIEPILKLLKNLNILNKHLFIVSYPSKKENITLKLSNISQVRFIWGGNETVNTIRKLSDNPYLKDVAFPDRYSVSYTDLNYFFSLPEKEQKNFVKNFIKDINTFYQLACSSPRMIFLKGTDKQIRKFINLLLDLPLNLPEEIINRKLKNIMILSTSAKIKKVYKNALDNLVFLEIKDIDEIFYKNLFIGGMVLLKKVKSIREIGKYIPENIQTFTYFSKRKPNLKNFKTQPLRLVKVGEALNFSHIWDGYNLILENLRWRE